MGVGTGLTAGYSEITGSLTGSGFTASYQEDAVADLQAVVYSGGSIKIPGATADNVVLTANVKGPTGNDLTLVADTGQDVVIGGDGELNAPTVLLDSVDKSTTGTLAIGGTNATILNIGNASATATITGGGISLAGGSSEIDLTTTGALDLNSGAFTLDCSTALITPTSTFGVNATGAVDIDSGGAVSINSSGGAINVGNDDIDQAINLGTNGERTITLGSDTGASPINIVSGTGAINIGTTAAARTVNIGTATGGSNMNIKTGTGELDVTGGGAFDLNMAGAVTIDSSGGAISIGADDVDQAINIGTTGSRTISIGSAAGGGHTTNIQMYADSGQLVQINGDAKVTGDLTVLGTTTTVETETLQVQDNYIYLSDGYESTTALPGGININYGIEASPATISVASGGFTAGVASTSNPTVAVDTASGLSAGDLIQVHNANNTANDGVYEVLSHTGSVITIKGVGVTATTQNFPKNDFVTDATVAGTIHKVNVSVIDIDSSGDWQVGKGNTTTGWSYSALSTGNPALSAVLAQGNTSGANDIIMADDRYIYFGTDSDASIRYDETTNDEMQIACAGGIAMTSAGGVNLGASTGLTILDDQTITLGTGSDATLKYDEVTNDVLEISCSTGILIPDDQLLYFGNGKDASITYDELTDDKLEITCTLGITVTGPTTFASLATFNSGLKVLDDQSITLGTGSDATIKYDEAVDDRLEFSCVGGFLFDSGQARFNDRIVIADSAGALDNKPIYFGTNDDGSILYDETTDDALEIACTGAGGIHFLNNTKIRDDLYLYFGNDNDGSIRYNETGDDELEIVCTGTGGIFIQASGAAIDLTFGARSASITLNESGEESLDGSFTASSIVGALNELKTTAGSASEVVSIYTTTGLTVGAPVYISANDTCSHGDADAAASSRIIGLVLTVGGAGVGEVVTKGTATASFAAGDSGYAAGDPVYLSTTTGRVTFTAPTASGDTVIRIGYLKDTTGLSATTVDGETAEIEVMIGEPILIG